MRNLSAVGEMAELSSINVHTLRYYGGIDIPYPEAADPGTGYRYYSARQFKRLNTVKYLRALGVSFRRIVLFFEDGDVSIMLGPLKGQKDKAQAKISELMQIEQKLEHHLRTLEDAIHAQCGEIRTLHLDQRQIAYLRKDIKLGEGLEFLLWELERVNALEPAMFLGKVGAFLPPANPKTHKLQSFSGIFVLLEEEGHYQGKEQYLQAGDYVGMRSSGTHRKASQYYILFLGHMNQTGYSCRGDSVGVTLIGTGFTNNASRYMTEIQTPFPKSAEK